MRRRRRFFLWSAVLCVAVAAGARAHAPEDTLLWKALFDAGHALFGGLLAFLCLRLSLAWNRRAVATRQDRWLALAGALGVGLLFEIVQFFLPRDADLMDWLRDGLGAAAFLLSTWALRPRRAGSAAPRTGQRILAMAAALLLLAGAFASVATLANATRQRNAAFPLLLQPGAAWLQPFLALQNADWDSTERPSSWTPSTGTPKTTQVARVTFHAGSFPGFAIRETTPDWRAAQTLLLEVFSDLPAPVDIVLRIDDASHDQTFDDRFNQALRVVPGGQVFRIPLDRVRTAPARREMDMAHIRRLVIFAHDVREPFTLSFGTIWLE